MEKKDTLLGVIRTLFKWKKQIFYCCLLAGIGSIIITLLLPNYFKSITIFLVSSPDRAKREILFNDGSLEGEYYGNENDIDRILTISKSNELVDHLVDSFNLYDHYEINPDHPKGPHRVRKRFFKLYEVVKTKRDAIELSVEDKNKDLASRIANAARNKIDEIAQRLIKESQLKEIQIYDADEKRKAEQLRVLSDSLIFLRGKFGIYSTKAQTETLTAQVSQAESKLVRSKARLAALKDTPGIPADTIKLLNAAVTGMNEEVAILNDKMKKFNAGMPIVDIFESQYLQANQQLSKVKELNKQVKAAYNSNIPAILLVESAEVPLVKSRPTRSLLVIGACMLAFFFSMIGVLLLEANKEINWSEIINAK